ncbi:MAG: hypothetical protein IKE27_06155 [Oscillospiraceae bacterium]|nr:hypothetical protein [Oscillospiraceae bacterium]
MSTYNDIGINEELDWQRIRKLFLIGLFGGILTLTGDMLLGWGVMDDSLTGTARILSAYTRLSDSRIFWSAFLGFIGIPLEGLCYFGIYRLIAPYSLKYAHIYRSGILGYLIFAACGVHVPCLACVFFYKYMNIYAPEQALDLSIRFGEYFLLPGMIALEIFHIIHSIAHIAAFSKGLTPYPRWCWIFSLPVGMAAVFLLNFAGNSVLMNGITAGWISIGHLWMFGGLLLTMNKAKTNIRSATSG